MIKDSPNKSRDNQRSLSQLPKKTADLGFLRLLECILNHII